MEIKPRARPDAFVVQQDVPARDALFRYSRGIRQRPHTGVGIANALPRQLRGRDNPVGLGQEKIDLPFLRLDLVEISVVAGIGRANQVEIVPRDNEERPPILPGFGVERVSRCAREGIDDDVAPFAAPDQARPLSEVAPGEHLIDPGSGDVDDHRRRVSERLAGQDVIPCHASNAPIFAEDLTDVVIGADLRSVGARIERVLEGKSFRVLDLRIVVKRRTE